MSSKKTGINRIFETESYRKLKTSLHDGTFRDVLYDWKWIFRYTKNYKWKIVIYTVFGVITSTLALITAYVSRTLINVIAQRQSDRVAGMAVAFVLMTVATIAFQNISQRVYCKFRIYVRNDIQKDIFDNVLDSEWLEMNKFSNGDIVNRFSDDVETIAGSAISWIPDLAVTLYSFIVTFIVMFRMDKIMAFIALLSAPFLLLMSRFVVRKSREYKKAIKETRSEMMSFAVETFYNTDVIKSFGVVKNSAKKLVEIQKKNQDITFDTNLFEIKTRIVTSVISFVVSALALGYCLAGLWAGRILFGDMSFFLSRSSSLSSSFKSLTGMVPEIISSAVASRRIRELVELPRESHDSESFEVMKQYAKSGITVKMDNVSFSYYGKNKVYSHGNFVAYPNEIVAVLGPSGEGKTTMLRLLLGLVKPEQGTVLLEAEDGTSREMNSDMRNLFSYVPQGNTVMSGTVADNLRMVKSDATDEEITEALRLSCALNFVNEKENGIYASVGEKGKGLSEGQAQRIAIARAILNDAPVLLLDEATSALDEATESAVLQNIIRRCPNKTCIVSTHRKSVLKQCNRIYVIKDMQMHEYKSAEEYFASRE